MQVSAFAAKPYAQPVPGLKSARATEYEIIARITARLHSAAQDLPISFPELAAALDDNRKLWVAFASDVALPDNALPHQLRIQVLNLAQFTLAHTAQVLRENADVAPLIDINLAIMKGLSGKEAMP
jgi:flagellar protein FlaF